jgi:hypothetical protein
MKKKLLTIALLLLWPSVAGAANASFTWTANDKIESVYGYHVFVETISTGTVKDMQIICKAGIQSCCQCSFDGLQTGTAYRAWTTAIGYIDDKMVESLKSGVVYFVGGEGSQVSLNDDLTGLFDGDVDGLDLADFARLFGKY